MMLGSRQLWFVGRGRELIFCAVDIDIDRKIVKVVVIRVWKEDVGVGPEFLVRTGSNIEEI